jgi:AcrR family transcriptional regulator
MKRLPALSESPAIRWWSKAAGSGQSRRLPKEQRRQHLLDTALQIIRDEGADRLTFGHLAEGAGVSKPVAYDHFGTRAGLLIELYKVRNTEQANALRAALTAARQDVEETVETLAANYIHSSAEMCGEWQAVSAALTGSEETDLVYRELLDGYVELFTSALGAHTTLPAGELRLVSSEQVRR